MLALGVASFSHVNGTHFQNDTDLDRYLSRVQAGELPLYRGLSLTADERLIREFILQLKLGCVQRDYFTDKFKVDVTERFSDALAKWQALGFLQVSDQTISLSRDGLLQADALLPAFFLPQQGSVGPDTVGPPPIEST